MEPSENWSRELAVVLYCQKGVVVACVVLAAAAAELAVRFVPPVYETRGSVMLQAGRLPASPGSLGVNTERIQEVTQEDLASEVEILRSVGLAERVLSEGRKEDGTRVPTATSRPDPRVRRLQDRLTVEIQPASKIIQIALRGGDPGDVAATLNALLDQYVAYRMVVLNPQEHESFYAERARQYRDQLDQLEQELLAHTRRTSVTSPEREIEINLELKSELVGKLEALRDQGLNSRFVANPEVERRIAQVKQALNDIDQRNVQLQEQSVERKRISRETTLAEYSYQGFARKREEARIARAIASASLSADVTVMGRPHGPAEQVFPKRLPMRVAGVVAGLLVGLTLGFLREFFDHTCKTPRDVWQHVGLPVLFSIRRSRHRLG